MRATDESPEAAGPKPASRLRRVINRLWWLHSFGALIFGVGVMLFARKGLDYAETVLVVLSVSWLLVFVAFRVIVGSRNRKPDERLAKKGLRLLTNYVIKQLYQQMFFFLVPLYAASATWAFSSANWWPAPLLLLCAVLSTMDLVFDNFIMERRVIASGMYGLCMFGVLNLVLPLVFGFEHFVALLVAAAATAPTVALMGFPLRSVFSTRGLAVVSLLTVGLSAGAYLGRRVIPPVPMTLVHGGIGHGTPGAYECIPGPKAEIRSDQIDQLRCVTEVREPGGLKSELVHRWLHRGEVIAEVVELDRPSGCSASVFASRLATTSVPDESIGTLSCVVVTDAGQLVGRRDVEIIAAPDADANADAGPTSRSAAGPTSRSAAGSAPHSVPDAGSTPHSALDAGPVPNSVSAADAALAPSPAPDAGPAPKNDTAPD